MRLSITTITDDGEQRESILEVNENDIERLRPMSPDEAIAQFKARLLLLMEDFVNDALASLVPEGVSVDSWVRRHNITVYRIGNFSGLREMATVVEKDGERVIEVKFKNGKVLARVSLAKGFD